ncbi:MAG: hydrogenase formation protein HypD [Methanobacteriota archaeon]
MLNFRDEKLAQKIVQKIEEYSEKLKFCHVCGTHEYAITRFGLRSLLPENIEVIAGPGCPVCITPAKEIDESIWLAEHGIIITTFGDVVRVPGSRSSLDHARAKGADVRIVYSPADAVEIAEKSSKDVVFFATGFETTAPATASIVLNSPPENFSMLISHRLIPPAMELMVGVGEHRFDGFIAPGHVSTIIGLRPYQLFPEAYRVPVVVAGFEPLDVLMAIAMLLKQVKEGNPHVENEYTRSVTKEGNIKAQEIINRVFEATSGHWRGIGRISDSALKLRKEFSEYDARLKYNIKLADVRELDPSCSCHLVIVGKLAPQHCKLFGKACTPQKPRGPCMVSMEGTCQIAYRYGSQHFASKLFA